MKFKKCKQYDVFLKFENGRVNILRFLYFQSNNLLNVPSKKELIRRNSTKNCEL